jgi:hypothetical protein
MDLMFSQSDPIDDEGNPSDGIRNFMELWIIFSKMAKETIVRQ